MEKKTADRWWDKLGTPQYGGEMVVRSTRNIVNFDPYNGAHLTEIYGAWLERLCAEDWTLDPAVFSYKTMAPNHFLRGHLAESWEFSDPYTLVFHLRKESTGKICRRSTVASLLLTTSLFIITGYWALVTVSPNRPHIMLLLPHFES